LNGEPLIDLKYCSFCGKSEHEVRKLATGPCVFICNECVELCASIFMNDGVLRDDAEAVAAEWSRRARRSGRHSTPSRRKTPTPSNTDSGRVDDERIPRCTRWIGCAWRSKRSSHDDGDISIAFNETAEELADVAAWVAAQRRGGTRAQAVEGIEMTLWMSGRALLREYERRLEILNLGALLEPRRAPQDEPRPNDLRLLREGVNDIIERNPNTGGLSPTCFATC